MATGVSFQRSDSWIPDLSQKSACNPSSPHSSSPLFPTTSLTSAWGEAFVDATLQLKITHWLPSDYRVKTHLQGRHTAT